MDLSLFRDVVQTLSGLMMNLARDIPKEGHVVRFADWSFEVVDMDGNRIDKVLATRLESVTEDLEGSDDENTHS